MEKPGAASSPDVPQRTLKNAIHCSGIGRHSGAKIAMTLRPAPPDLGIVFSRIDLNHRPWIPASWEHAVANAAATGLVNESGVEVAGIEHLMSALSGCTIDNAMIELDGPELPAMDGSAAPFVFLLECAGSTAQNAPRRALEIRSPIQISEGRGSVTLAPGSGLTLDVACESPRHFDFLDPADDAECQEGRPDNAVTVLGDRIADDLPLRFTNEFVRHQTQCMIGDLYLAGGPVIGLATVRSAKPGMMIRLLEKLFSDTAAWSWRDLARPRRPSSPEPREPARKTAAVGA
jgi:UDP-3-O-[3-hydroxymyristoyl] N-acetylglucosamine deacetylase